MEDLAAVERTLRIAGVSLADNDRTLTNSQATASRSPTQPRSLRGLREGASEQTDSVGQAAGRDGGIIVLELRCLGFSPGGKPTVTSLPDRKNEKHKTKTAKPQLLPKNDRDPTR